MNKEDEENLHRVCGEIKRFVREGDYSSAQLLVSALRKFIADLKKEKQGDLK